MRFKENNDPSKCKPKDPYCACYKGECVFAKMDEKITQGTMSATKLKYFMSYFKGQVRKIELMKMMQQRDQQKQQPTNVTDLSGITDNLDLGKNHTQYLKNFVNQIKSKVEHIPVSNQKLPKAKCIAGRDTDSHIKLNAKILPSMVDYRFSEIVSKKVYDQKKNCGSAFSVAEMIESRHAFKSDVHKVQSLSRQQLTDCVKTKCKTGIFSKTLKYILHDKMFLESDYDKKGYTGKKEECKADSVTAKPIKAGVKDFIVHKKLTVSEIKYLLLSGPVAVSVDAKPDEFVFYKRGVLKYKCSAPNHSVLLVGYYDPRNKKGDKISKVMKGVTLDKPVWIVKNSWGEIWGSKGYAFLEMSEDWDACGMYTQVHEFIK